MQHELEQRMAAAEAAILALAELGHELAELRSVVADMAPTHAPGRTYACHAHVRVAGGSVWRALRTTSAPPGTDAWSLVFEGHQGEHA
jgi:hypothetical protein